MHELSVLSDFLDLFIIFTFCVRRWISQREILEGTLHKRV